ncbi:hypothetical protein F5144DRAFT_578139 [Chaetomium tenue]|uniref:Uncharacterized protein n=1 Tax=Chaetomium tenue TaxID=1854479 RepID=A0ACB7P2S8_9PEZI|nr:hypothetical protein F5144DRAFT_578139 [Chaetomium globosum]
MTAVVAPRAAPLSPERLEPLNLPNPAPTAGLQPQLLLPGEAGYAARQESYWSLSSGQVQPAAIFRPSSAQDVSAAVQALVQAKQPFAVRSGGHGFAFSNNIDGGVTIDLGQLSTVVYDIASETVTFGAGCLWQDVYDELHKYGRAVSGAREGDVGVGGLLLGGGVTFFTSRHGFACDNVLAYEVVLADGRTVNVDRESHPDLFRCLKGGSNNFGVVTKFTMVTIPCAKVWGGMAVMPRQAIPAAIESVVSFADNVVNDADSDLTAIITHTPEFKDVVVSSLFVNVAGVEKPAAYDQWLAQPQIRNTAKMTSLPALVREAKVPGMMREIWFTLTLKNDARILTYASALHDQLVADLTAFIPGQEFITKCIFQHLPTVAIQNSVAAGRNVMGVERQQHNGILFHAISMVMTNEQEAFAYEKVKTWVDSVEEFSRGIEGGLLEWRYLNYANKTQDPMATYGEENIRLMQGVAAKYDPEEVFQRLCPGGFKVLAIGAQRK